MNNKLDPDDWNCIYDDIAAKYSYLSSSSVKQVAKFGGCIKGLVPDEIISDIMRKINK